MEVVNFKVLVLLSLVSIIYCVPVPVALETLYNFPFVSREDWGAVPATDQHPLRKPVDYVLIHHTYIPAACYDTEICKADMRSMQRYHNSLDWGDIGYNFCVGSEGSAFEGRGWDVIGIHAMTANNYSIGICLIGDWRTELPPQATLDTTKALINAGVQNGAISANYKLIGHQQAVATECPGKRLLKEISNWDHYTPGPFIKPNITYKYDVDNK